HPVCLVVEINFYITIFSYWFVMLSATAFMVRLPSIDILHPVRHIVDIVVLEGRPNGCRALFFVNVSLATPAGLQKFLMFFCNIKQLVLQNAT
ncbi:unnamed protein product, partial [Nesidiocoris tenuis]